MVVVAEAQLVIKQHYLIARSMSNRKGEIDPQRQKMLEVMLGGRDVEDGEKNQIARNTQFELWIASLLTMGGAKVNLAEPDVRLLHEGRDVGIAVKRLASPRIEALIERVKEAESQIRAHGGDGFVAVNVDSIVKRRDQIDELTAERKQYERFSKKAVELNGSVRVGESLLGLLYFGTTVEWFYGDTRPQFRLYNFHSARTIDDGSGESRMWKNCFHDVFTLMNERLQALQG